MSIPEPRPGLVIRYDYVWVREAALGHSHGKDRPACLIAASDPATKPRFVVILPITRTPPREGAVGVSIPPKVRRAIGLDDKPSWIVVSEHNVDEWPNPGLRPLPGKRGIFSYGFIPPRLFARVKAQFIEIGGAGTRR